MLECQPRAHYTCAHGGAYETEATGFGTEIAQFAFGRSCLHGVHAHISEVGHTPTHLYGAEAVFASGARCQR